MAIVKKTVQIGDLPTKEALKEVEEAAKKRLSMILILQN